MYDFSHARKGEATAFSTPNVLLAAGRFPLFHRDHPSALINFTPGINLDNEDGQSWYYCSVSIQQRFESFPEDEACIPLWLITWMLAGDSLRGSSIKIGTRQRRLLD